MRSARLLFAPLLVIMAPLATAMLARAQEYHSRPAAVVVPFAPGGAVDRMARLISGKLEQRLGKSFVIEILDRLNAELTAVLALPKVKEQILKFGCLPLQNRSVDELRSLVKSEIVRWGKV